MLLLSAAGGEPQPCKVASAKAGQRPDGDGGALPGSQAVEEIPLVGFFCPIFASLMRQMHAGVMWHPMPPAVPPTHLREGAAPWLGLGEQGDGDTEP